MAKDIDISNPTLRLLSIISASTVVRGDIRLENDLRIDGNVEGDVCSRGRIVIGSEGCVKGKITGKYVEVAGKAFGDIMVSDILILRAACYCEGHIVGRTIEIEAGASFYGNCRMEKNEIPKISTIDVGRGDIISVVR